MSGNRYENGANNDSLTDLVDAFYSQFTPSTSQQTSFAKYVQSSDPPSATQYLYSSLPPSAAELTQLSEPPSLSQIKASHLPQPTPLSQTQPLTQV